MHYMHTNIVCVATATDTDTDTDTTDTDTANYQTITLNLFCNAIFSLHYFLLPYTATFFLL